MLNAIKKRGAAFALVAGVAGLMTLATMNAGARARDGAVAAPLVASKIAVETLDGHLRAKITIDNHSEHTVFVPRVLVSEGEQEGKLFEVRDSSNGDPLDYIGMMVKRPAPTKKDYVAIKPHGQLSNSFEIGHAYRFISGRHAYQISFSGSYVADLNKFEQSTPIDTATAMFAHVAP